MILEFTLINRKIGEILIKTDLGLKVFFGMLLLIMETFGNYLLLCMVWYEKFRMDSKKRTVTNQLLSRLIFALIFFNIFFMPLFFGALLIPYSEYFQGFMLLFTKCFAQISITFFGSRWICISHRWIWSISYSHASMANTGRNGYFQDFLYVQVFSHLCNGWIFPYTFFNTVQYYD